MFFVLYLLLEKTQNLPWVSHIKIEFFDVIFVFESYFQQLGRYMSKWHNCGGTMPILPLHF